MPVISGNSLRRYVGGGDVLRISGGTLVEEKEGTTFYGDDGSSTFYKGVSFSTNGAPITGTAYQLNGTIHINKSWANSSFNQCDFAHEYGHYLQQQSMSTIEYAKLSAKSLISGFFNTAEEHLRQNFEMEATRLGEEYMDANIHYSDGTGVY
ncbi:MAG: hypothetical protein QM654_14645 [Dysgonamonadaceae bacterium]